MALNTAPSDHSTSPENFPDNRTRISNEVRSVLKECGGIDIAPAALVDGLVDVVTYECAELRDRIASRIVGKLIGRYDDLSDEKLERLAYVVLKHYEDNSGDIQIAFDDTED